MVIISVCITYYFENFFNPFRTAPKKLSMFLIQIGPRCLSRFCCTKYFICNIRLTQRNWEKVISLTFFVLRSSDVLGTRKKMVDWKNNCIFLKIRDGIGEKLTKFALIFLQVFLNRIFFWLVLEATKRKIHIKTQHLLPERTRKKITSQTSLTYSTRTFVLIPETSLLKRRSRTCPEFNIGSMLQKHSNHFYYFAKSFNKVYKQQRFFFFL